MRKAVASVGNPTSRYDVVKVEKNGTPVIVRIMVLHYDGNFEVYYQEEGYSFEFAYGVQDNCRITKVMSDAQINVFRWGLHYEL